jgi:hypothetical protein
MALINAYDGFIKIIKTANDCLGIPDFPGRGAMEALVGVLEKDLAGKKAKKDQEKKVETLRESVEHWRRMIDWVEKDLRVQGVEWMGPPSREHMRAGIGEAWDASDCPLCKLYAFYCYDKTTLCPFRINDSCGDGLWNKVNYSWTWKGWHLNAKRLLNLMISIYEQEQAKLSMDYTKKTIKVAHAAAKHKKPKRMKLKKIIRVLESMPAQIRTSGEVNLMLSDSESSQIIYSLKKMRAEMEKECRCCKHRDDRGEPCLSCIQRAGRIIPGNTIWEKKPNWKARW